MSGRQPADDWHIRLQIGPIRSHAVLNRGIEPCPGRATLLVGEVGHLVQHEHAGCVYLSPTSTQASLRCRAIAPWLGRSTGSPRAPRQASPVFPFPSGAPPARHHTAYLGQRAAHGDARRLDGACHFTDGRQIGPLTGGMVTSCRTSLQRVTVDLFIPPVFDWLLRGSLGRRRGGNRRPRDLAITI